MNNMCEREMNSSSREEAIVIVGGGICGLATALALHRKGLKSKVLERGESLRAEGAAIGIYTNGWRALDQLGVGSLLRAKSIQLSSEVSINNGAKQEILFGKEEVRCLKRSDLLEILADALPPETICFGCRVVGIKMGSTSSYPSIELEDGSTIEAKVLIGCDGANSVVGQSLGLEPPKFFSITAARGLTYYPKGQPHGHHFFRIMKNNMILGRIPINSNLLHWFIGWPCVPQDSQVAKEPDLIREAIAEYVKDFPTEIIEMVQNSDLSSLSLTPLRFRPPWELLLGNFWKGTTTVAGDSMHVMGPFLGQGGSAGLEDAVVLGRCLAQQVRGTWDKEGPQLRKEIGLAIQRYLKERRMRLLRLTTQTYLMGMIRQTSWVPLKLVLGIAVSIIFGSPLSHAQYDCGHL